jgi:adenylate cyclase
MSETRKLAAILVADVVGYSRLAGADEDRTLARLRGLRSDLIDPAIAAHRGRIVKRTGDGSIIEFRSVVDAVRCAIEVQNGLIDRNAGVPEDKRIQFRVGIHVGDVVEESDGDLMGEGIAPKQIRQWEKWLSRDHLCGLKMPRPISQKISVDGLRAPA